MPPNWNWDFEDEHSARRRRGESGEAAPASGPAPASARLAQIRRRRAGAIALAIAALVALVLALTGSARKGAASASSRAGVGGARAALAHPAGDPENDQTAAVSSVLAYTPFVRMGSARVREAALTFDDGPGPYTPAILKVLEQFHVHATFFPVGRMERYFSASTVRAIEDGDVIGNHTETHPMLAHLSVRDQREELLEQIARVELAGGQRPVLFRPPYGSFNASTLGLLHSLHMLMVMWSVDTRDYTLPGVGAIVQGVLAGAKPGAIILLHDGGGDRSQTVAALPGVIRGLRARGYRLVTVPRMLLDDPPPAGQTLPPNLSGG